MQEKMSKLSEIDTIINPFFKAENENLLEEKQENMKIEIKNENQRFLLFNFDKNLKKSEYPRGLFPFFNKSEAGVTSMCDYILFAEYKGELFALLIELKKGKENTTLQLNAGKIFVRFIIETLNRVDNFKIDPKIRMISIRERHKKPQQKQKEVEYDNLGFHTFMNKDFKIKSYLK